VGDVIAHLGGMAADASGHVYGLDFHYDQVWKFIPGTQPDMLSNGFGQPASAAGNLFGSDDFHNKVSKLSAGARSATVLPCIDLDNPGDVAVDDRGDVYVFDEMHFRVLKLPIR
jgi:serine/threonine-protein kinase